MVFFLSLWHAIKEIFHAPFIEPRLWWQLAPIFLLWITLSFYLNYQKHEQLGWNSALANGLTLFWIGVGAMQPLFTLEIGERILWSRFFMILPMIVYGIFLTYISFTHKLSERATYIMATPTIVYYLNVYAILWGNKVLDVNKYILLGFLVLWGVAFAFRWFLFWVLPEATHGEEAEHSEHEF